MGLFGLAFLCSIPSSSAHVFCLAALDTRELISRMCTAAQKLQLAVAVEGGGGEKGGGGGCREAVSHGWSAGPGVVCLCVSVCVCVGARTRVRAIFDSTPRALALRVVRSAQ